ncbi:WD repeat-containing protein 62 [Plakobranchus ocellatus]|uniref:WD repeat-containing protein 62 n=1 Tax=Plakobranchus ocellatus TaxID=259542 RepID=A0AAV3Y978_9GAST|nr:WD repeat-containing protein 62 [Plakobranchus ocellatus]
MNLDLVLGMSCKNIGCLACDQNSGLVANTASGVLVVLNTRTNCQVKYFHVRKNCVSSASFSHDGRYVTTGETGHRPAVRVWRIKDGQEVATMYGHEFGIKCVQFGPTMREIISVGLEHDNVVNVWAWPSGHRIAANNIVGGKASLNETLFSS